MSKKFRKRIASKRLKSPFQQRLAARAAAASAKRADRAEELKAVLCETCGKIIRSDRLEGHRKEHPGSPERGERTVRVVADGLSAELALARAENAKLKARVSCPGCGKTFVAAKLDEHLEYCGVKRKKRKRLTKKRRSVWAVSGGLPSLGKRR